MSLGHFVIPVGWCIPNSKMEVKEFGKLFVAGLSELLTSHIFVRTFKPCLGCLVHVVSVSLCYMVVEPATLLGVPCPEWEIPC